MSSGTDNPRTPEDINKTIVQARDELTRMIDLNPQVMLLVDPNNIVLRTNRALLELLGLPHYNNALQRPLSELFPCNDPAFFTGLMRDHGCDGPREAEITLPDGNTRLFTFTLVGAGRHAEQFAIIVNDITQEKRQAELAAKEHKMEAVEALVGGLMHNVNQPLTVMLVRAQLLHLAMEKGTVEPDEIKESLQDMVRMTLQISEMVKNVASLKDFVTEPYVGNVDILDIYGSGAGAEELISSSTPAMRALLDALEAHDPDARGHSQRTARYAVFLARKMDMCSKEIAFAQRAAFVHDIGKLGIPDRILQKSDKLTTDETIVMQTHPVIGYNILQSFPAMLQEADIAYSHHENLDGSGYPRGLAGDDLSLTVRLVSVADSFDAMHSERPYRDSMSADEAASRIIAGSGTAFDPDIVKAFQASYKEMLASTPDPCPLTCLP